MTLNIYLELVELINITNCNFVVDLDIDKLEDNTHKNMSLKGNEFYIKNTKL